MLRGMIEQLLKVDPVHVLEPERRRKEGQVLFYDILIHGLCVDLLLAFIHFRPAPGVRDKGDIVVPEGLPLLNLATEVSDLLFQILAGFL